MKTGICLLTVIPMRRDPSEKSEMVSQVLFGEVFGIEEEHQGWYRIVTEFDRYAGWIDMKMASPVSDGYYRKILQMDYRVSEEIASSVTRPDGGKVIIVAGSTLSGKDTRGEFSIDTLRYKMSDTFSENKSKEKPGIVDTAMGFLHCPYLWGGRTPFGYDCSGFTQIVCKIRGIRLPRDAWQQALAGQPANINANPATGDMVFFSDTGGDICHVGFALPSDRIIHCSGMVRIDRLDEKGIFNTETGQYTHRMHSVRRILPK
jgi:cell wall-associated NlpC family hydrolase